MNIDLAQSLIRDFHQSSQELGVAREQRRALIEGKADVIYGMRRAGKTTLLQQTLAERVRLGVERERTVYLNLEDDRLEPLERGDLAQFLEVYFRLFPAMRAQEVWLGLDEVQNAPGWERFVRRVLDQGGIRLLITGSSAKLLSQEIATSMRGRSLSTELLPFSFRECLHFHEIVPPQEGVSAKEGSELAHAFDRYLEVGGFPEVQSLDTLTRRRVLQEYLDVALLRDVVERHALRNVTAVRALMRRLVRNTSRMASYSKLHRELRAMGLRLSKNSVAEWTEHFHDACLVHLLPMHSRSESQQQANPKKVYLVDPALMRALQSPTPQDQGHVLENLVFLELRRRGYVCSYVLTERGGEVDFLAEHPVHSPLLVQVSASMEDPNTERRELRALEDALGSRLADRGLVVTLYEQDERRLRGRPVEIASAWRWFAKPLEVS